MKTRFFATIAIVLIGLSGAAWAQEAAPTGEPDPAAETATQDPVLKKTDTAEPATDTADTAGTEDPAADMDPAAETAGTDDTAEPATDTAGTVSERMRSYSGSATTEPLTGSVVGGRSADNLIGMSVVDSEGESMGEVSDLIIGSDDVVQQAIIEVGGFLGFGAKTTAVDLEHATVDESKGEVTLDISRAEIDEMPEYERDDEGWFTG